MVWNLAIVEIIDLAAHVVETAVEVRFVVILVVLLLSGEANGDGFRLFLRPLLKAEIHLSEVFRINYK